MSYAETTERTDLPFGLWTRVGRRKHKFNRIREVAPMYPTTLCRERITSATTSLSWVCIQFASRFGIVSVFCFTCKSVWNKTLFWICFGFVLRCFVSVARAAEGLGSAHLQVAGDDTVAELCALLSASSYIFPLTLLEDVAIARLPVREQDVSITYG